MDSEKTFHKADAAASSADARSECSALAHAIYKAWMNDERWRRLDLAAVAKGNPHAFFWAEIAARTALAQSAQSRSDKCIDCDGEGKYPSGAKCKSCGGSGRVLLGDGITDAALAQPSVPAGEQPSYDAEDHMIQIDRLIADMLEIQRKFGNTCVYIRRGGVSWGAVALNRRDDDKANGVFDLQKQHDRDMLARIEQVDRLIKDRDEWRERAWKAEKAAAPEPPTDQAVRSVPAEIEQLRAALKPFADAANSVEQYRDDNAIGCGIVAGDLRRARAAIEAEQAVRSDIK